MVLKIIQNRVGTRAIGLELRWRAKRRRISGKYYHRYCLRIFLSLGLNLNLSQASIIVTLGSLDRQALVQILTGQKCLVKQYRRLFELDDTLLSLKRGLLKRLQTRRMAQYRRKGLRAIIEELWLDVML